MKPDLIILVGIMRKKLRTNVPVYKAYFKTAQSFKLLYDCEYLDKKNNVISLGNSTFIFVNWLTGLNTILS